MKVLHQIKALENEARALTFRADREYGSQVGELVQEAGRLLREAWRMAERADAELAQQEDTEDARWG